jgi:hypothetical protein
VALSGIFAEQCNTLHVVMKNTREKFQRELIEGQIKACEDLCCQEASIQRALRGAVVDDVMKLFP